METGKRLQNVNYEFISPAKKSVWKLASILFSQLTIELISDTRTPHYACKCKQRSYSCVIRLLPAQSARGKVISKLKDSPLWSELIHQALGALRGAACLCLRWTGNKKKISLCAGEIVKRSTNNPEEFRRQKKKKY